MRKPLLQIAALLLAAAPAQAQTFDVFLNQLNALPQNERQAKVDSFLQAASSIPITEDTLAHFIYSGTGGSVTVPGDFSGWSPTNAPMTQIAGTNFWYRTEIFKNDARLDYKINFNTNTWILDPRNPFTAPGGFGSNSELRMPAYVPPVEIGYFAEIAHGTVQDTVFSSSQLSNSRSIKIYLPPGYDQSTEAYPVVLIHDGLEYISFAKMNNVLDYLIAENQIRPAIAVFVPPVERTPEYISNKQQAFTNFIVAELIPWLDGRYRTLTDPGSRAVMGSSAGGNISLWIGMQHPEMFGNIGAFSSFIENDIQTTFQNSGKLPLRIYMNHGIYDHLTAIHESVDAFVPILRAKGYDFRYEEYSEGHSYGFWRAYLDEALMMFFPGTATSLQGDATPPVEFDLAQNFPNPFFPNTQIRFALPKQSHLSVAVYNIQGKLVKSLVSDQLRAGKHITSWDGTDTSGQVVASGLYFYALRTADFSMTRKMVKLK